MTDSSISSMHISELPPVPALTLALVPSVPNRLNRFYSLALIIHSNSATLSYKTTRAVASLPSPINDSCWEFIEIVSSNMFTCLQWFGCCSFGSTSSAIGADISPQPHHHQSMCHLILSASTPFNPFEITDEREHRHSQCRHSNTQIHGTIIAIGLY